MTIFERIIAREIPADIIFENERIIVIKDIHPKAPIHLLGITKLPLENLHQLLQTEQKELLWELYHTLSNLAVELHTEHGYRLTSNIGPESGQEVPHLHVHLLGGWPAN